MLLYQHKCARTLIQHGHAHGIAQLAAKAGGHRVATRVVDPSNPSHVPLHVTVFQQLRNRGLEHLVALRVEERAVLERRRFRRLRPVGEAPRRVEHAGLVERVRRARVDAEPAFAAVGVERWRRL